MSTVIAWISFSAMAAFFGLLGPAGVHVPPARPRLLRGDLVQLPQHLLDALPYLIPLLFEAAYLFLRFVQQRRLCVQIALQPRDLLLRPFARRTLRAHQ